MTWDNELEKNAQTWADNLRNQNKMGHDPNLGDVSAKLKKIWGRRFLMI